MAVEAVGIAEGDGGDAATSREDAFTAVADGGSSGPLLDGDDDRVERGDGLQGVLAAVVEGLDAIETDADAHHVHLPFGKTYDAAGVENVALDWTREGFLEHVGAMVKIFKLTQGVLVLRRFIGHTQMREDAGGREYALAV